MGCLYSKDCFGQGHEPLEEYNKKQAGRKAVDNFDLLPDSSDEDAEEEDALNQLSITRDSDVGISRLPRISSQFLPPEGSRRVRVPIGNYELRYSYLSQRGFYPEALDKPNQDSFCIHTPFGTSPDDHFFGVFDGHGENGAQCSQFVKRKLCENLLKNRKFNVDAAEVCRSAFLATNSQLHEDSSLDDTMSGTTAITILVRGRTLYVANAGDSRAVIAEKRGSDIVAVDLSIDQTPYRIDELERVKHCGARVLTLDQIEGVKSPDVQCWGEEEGDDGDPPRLWVQNAMYPGTAFTRSLGDSLAESIGVVANPEIFVMELTSNHPFFVLASDGVFEFLSSQAVIDMVTKFKDPRDACAAVVAESYRLWLQYETRTDDITIIVVQINGLNDTQSLQNTPNASPRPIQQVVEAMGSESPSTITWNSKNHRVRNDISRARLRVIESSLENNDSWFTLSTHRKTWEEEAHIERALHDHFLFRRLTDSQRHVLLDCMQRIDVKPEDIVVQQGGDGDCFYVVGSGEFEVLVDQLQSFELTRYIEQDENGKDITRVLQKYSAEKLSSFGELALMYNKPLQASVCAVTDGTLWSLKREDFRRILLSEFANLSSLKLLRTVKVFSKLTILQLSRIGEALMEMSFSDGQKIIDKNDCLTALYIVQKGLVRLTYRPDLLSPAVSSHLNLGNHYKNNEEHVIEVPEGSHIGEWALLGESINSLTAICVGDVVCTVISKESFDSIVGPLSKLTPNDLRLESSSESVKESNQSEHTAREMKVQYTDLEWRMGICSTNCSEIGLVLVKNSDIVRSLKRFSKRRVKDLGKESQVLKEKDLMKSLSSSSTYVPQVLCTCSDQSYVGILLDSLLACSLDSLLQTPLDEPSAQFFAAAAVIALEELHEESIVYRGVSPDVLMVDQSGHLQFVDFRFAKKLTDERTFTICGNADTLAPEIVLGRGHGFAADWWSLGVLIYYMLQAEMPFGSWRESESVIFAKIAKGQLTLPETFSLEVVDLITKLLEVDEAARLGSQGLDAIKNHSWFNTLDWKQVADGTFPVTREIINRIHLHQKKILDDVKPSVNSPVQEYTDLNAPEWFEDW